MRLKRGKRGGEEKKAVENPLPPGLGGAPPREVPTMSAPPLRTHVTHDDQRLGFVERPYGPLDKTSPPATAGLRCAQPKSRLEHCVSHAAADSQTDFGAAFRESSGSCIGLTFRHPHKKSNRVSTSECEWRNLHAPENRIPVGPVPRRLQSMRLNRILSSRGNVTHSVT